MDLAQAYRKKADMARLLARQLPNPHTKDAYLTKAADYDRRADWIELERIRRSGTVINQPLAAAVGWRA